MAAIQTMLTVGTVATNLFGPSISAGSIDGLTHTQLPYTHYMPAMPPSLSPETAIEGPSVLYNPPIPLPDSQPPPYF